MPAGPPRCLTAHPELADLIGRLRIGDRPIVRADSADLEPIARLCGDPAVLLREVGDPEFLHRPPVRPVGGRQLVVGVVGGIGRRVDLAQVIDGEAAGPQCRDPFSVAGMVLHPADSGYQPAYLPAAVAAAPGGRARAVPDSTRRSGRWWCGTPAALLAAVAGLPREPSGPGRTTSWHRIRTRPDRSCCSGMSKMPHVISSAAQARSAWPSPYSRFARVHRSRLAAVSTGVSQALTILSPSHEARCMSASRRLKKGCRPPVHSHRVSHRDKSHAPEPPTCMTPGVKPGCLNRAQSCPICALGDQEADRSRSRMSHGPGQEWRTLPGSSRP